MQSKESEELTQIKEAENEKDENVINLEKINPIVQILGNKIKRRKHKKQTSNKIENKSTNFNTQKKTSTGRHTNEEKNKGKKATHTKDNVDNAKRKVYSRTLKNVHKVIKNKAKKYEKYFGHLYEPTIINKMGDKLDNDIDLINFAKLSLKEIYFSSLDPKSPKADNSLGFDEKIILQKEKEDENDRRKELNFLLNQNLKTFIIIYLKDIKFLNHLGEKIDLDEFKTLKNDKINLDDIIKERTKKNLFKLLGDKEN